MLHLKKRVHLTDVAIRSLPLPEKGQKDYFDEALLGNAGTLISFRLGAEDAGYISREFDSRFEVGDLLNLENRHIRLKMMIDGQPSRAFSATT
jgi:hypothetical protein